ncbi:cell division cycle protein 48 homolog [Salvia hispanica]|uniref:cell division cycle protein 48 homolog n=1 Tax=Salvia hispanica TaxID=49212 RepID=UPI002009CFCA|nr:cell division cycle protein 48 homolog [Salvia hispanica]
MDGRPKKLLFIIGATNRPDINFPPSVPGPFPVYLHPSSHEESRHQIFKSWVLESPRLQKRDPKHSPKYTQGFPRGHITEICQPRASMPSEKTSKGIMIDQSKRLIKIVQGMFFRGRVFSVSLRISGREKRRSENPEARRKTPRASMLGIKKPPHFEESMKFAGGGGVRPKRKYQAAPRPRSSPGGSPNSGPRRDRGKPGGRPTLLQGGSGAADG